MVLLTLLSVFCNQNSVCIFGFVSEFIMNTETGYFNKAKQACEQITGTFRER